MTRPIFLLFHPAFGFTPVTISPSTEGPRLTKREAQVLQLLFKAMPGKMIAAELGIADSTANSHRKALYRKLGAFSAADAVKKAIDLGLFDLTLHLK